MHTTSAASSKALIVFHTAAIYSTNETNKTGGTCHYAVYFLECLWCHPAKRVNKAEGSTHLSTTIALQVIDGIIDISIGENPYKKYLFGRMDFSNFFSVSEIMFTVCEPPVIKGTFNILRPFGYDIL